MALPPIEEALKQLDVLESTQSDPLPVDSSQTPLLDLPPIDQTLSSLETTSVQADTPQVTPLVESTLPPIEQALATIDSAPDQQSPIQPAPKASIDLARSQLGSQDYNGYCQTFVGDVTGDATWGTSALDAWQNSQDRAVQGLDGIKEGDLVYFVGNSPDAPGGTYENGHTGIYTGNGQFVSATGVGVQEADLGQWINDNNQSILGYIPR